MPVAIPRLVLVEGDPVLGMDAVHAMRGRWIAEAGSLQWVEMCPPQKKQPGDFLNSLDGEAATSDMGGEPKVVFLRGILGTKAFKDGLQKVVAGVAPGNSLVAFDEEGVIRADSKAKQKTGWEALRDVFAKRGEIVSVPPPFPEIGEAVWGQRVNTEQVKAVAEEMAKRGKRMSLQAARDPFLELAMHDWAYIHKELDRIAELVPGDSVTPDDIRRIAFPWSQQHAVYEFCVAFNSGNFQQIMDCYDDLEQSKFPPEAIYSYCTTLLRWQLVAAHLASYGQTLPSSLDAIGALMTKELAASKTAKLRMLKPRLFKEPKPGWENEVKDGITPFTSKSVSRFVKDVFTRRVPLRDGRLETLPFMQAAMTRYLTMINATEEFRLGGDRRMAKDIFRRTMHKVCWRG